MKLTGKLVNFIEKDALFTATIEVEPPIQTELDNLKVGNKVLVEVEIKELGQGRLKGTFKDIFDTDFTMSEIKAIGKE